MMNILKKLGCFLTLAVAFGLASCGSSGTTSIPFGDQGSSLSGLYVQSSSPAHNSSSVGATTRNMVIRMNEDVQQTSVNGQIELYEGVVYSNDGNEGGTNITPNYQISVNGSLISLQGTTDLKINTNYQIRMYAGLAATSGDTLLQGQTFQYFYINFSTGSGLGHSVPGAPKVTSVYKNNEGGCVGVIFQFNESLAYQPTVRIHYRPATLVSFITVFPTTFPVLPYDNSVWEAYICPIGNYSTAVAPDSTMDNYVDSFVDLDEGNMGYDTQDGTSSTSQIDHTIHIPLL